jgi:hypothetical protein
MINFGPKAGKKPKKARKDTSKVPHRRPGYFADALTREDVEEINLFSRLIAQNNARHL